MSNLLDSHIDVAHEHVKKYSRDVVMNDGITDYNVVVIWNAIAQEGTLGSGIPKVIGDQASIYIDRKQMEDNQIPTPIKNWRIEGSPNRWDTETIWNIEEVRTDAQLCGYVCTLRATGTRSFKSNK